MLGSYQMRIDNRLYDLIDANDYRRANFQDFDGMEYGAPSSTGFTEGNQLTLSSYINVKFAANVGVGWQSAIPPYQILALSITPCSEWQKPT